MSAGLRHHLAVRATAGAVLAVIAVAMVMVAAAVRFKADPSLLEWWVPIEALGPLLAATFASRTLAGIDILLERSTARQRPALRLAHVLAGVVLCVVPTTVAAAMTMPSDAVTATSRNSLGFFGAVLLFGAIMRAGTGWMPVCGYTLFVIAAGPRGTDGGERWWAWFVQPGSDIVAWWLTILLLAAGTVVYVRHGPVAGPE